MYKSQLRLWVWGMCMAVLIDWGGELPVAFEINYYENNRCQPPVQFAFHRE